MPLIAGIDIGNATTEVALASDDPQARAFVASGIVATTGMKGTRDNIAGTLAALEQALAKTPWSMSDVSRIYLNEAAPVIGDVAMETITETIITESTMIGHNPKTPGGVGLGSASPSHQRRCCPAPRTLPIFWWSPRPLTLPMSPRWSMRQRQRAIR